MTIHRLLYRSDVALIGGGPDVDRQVGDLVAGSAARNAQAGLTGALLLTRGVFVQVLEGPLPALEAAFERICCDRRHRRVALLEFVQADDRVFGPWAMARIAADRTVERLLPSAAGLADQAARAVPAQATIQLMRTLLVTGSADVRVAGRAERSA